MTGGLNISRVAGVAVAASGIALAGGAVATSASVTSGHNGSRPQSCASGTAYTHIRMNPAPFATFGSLQAGQSVSFFVQPLNGTACVAGAVVYVSITQVGCRQLGDGAGPVGVWRRDQSDDDASRMHH